MELTELINQSTIIGIEMHSFFLVLILLLYLNMRKSFMRNSRRKEYSLTHVYIGTALMVITDCAWTSVSNMGITNNTLAYIINILYFVGSSTAATCWFYFCINHLETVFLHNKTLRIVAIIPYVTIMVLYLLAPVYGTVFSIQDGAYIRGNLFFLDPIIKMGYICFASLLAIISGTKKEVGYLKAKEFNFVLFGVPVVVCGILQTLTGVDFNCLGVTFGLVLIYKTGITNPDSENTDAIYSLANSFEASYIVNMDTGLIRPLRTDIMHDKGFAGMESNDYMTHFNSVLETILLPEDKEDTLDAFNIDNVAKRFEIDNSFSVRYRVKEDSGQTAIHTASFVSATGKEGKQEFLLGINAIQSDSLLYERNERLSHENERLEQINVSIVESVAKMVEARDGGSGDHIVRVKKLTEIIAREVMTEYPEFNLDEERVKLISSASVLHDVGKISIPDAILLKPGCLTEEEFEVMKTHTTKGCDALNLFPLGLDDAFLECALSICRWHHEKYDGNGYPDGLKGEEIPIAAQIVAVADCLDALVSERPYKEAYTPDVAFEMIKNGECGEFSDKILCSMEKQKNRLTELVRLYR